MNIFNRTQPAMIPMAPEVAPDTATPAPLPVAGPLTSPYGGMLTPQQLGFSGPGNQSVLSTDDRQAKLGQAYDKMLQDVIRGESGAEKGRRVATEIFGDLVAPALTAFSRRGAAGGVALIQEAHNRLKDAQNEKRQRQQQTMQGLQSLTNIVNATSPTGLKALSNQVAAARAQTDKDAKEAANKAKQDELNLKKQREERLGKYATDKQAEISRHNKAMEGNAGVTQTLNWARLGLDQQKFKASESRLHEFFDRHEALTKRAQDLQAHLGDEKNRLEYARLEHSIRQNDEQLKLAKQNYNLHLKALEEKAAQHGATVTGLTPLEETGLNYDLAVQPSQFSEDPAVDAIIQKQQQEAAQPQGEPAPTPAATPQQGGGGVQAALQFYNSLPNNPQLREIARQQFIQKYGRDPDASAAK